jgi:hypothetical protein
MSREQPRIRRPGSKADAIGMLTAGLVIVSPGTKFILVEDEADASFYGSVRDVLSDQGPSKDPKALKPAPSLIFMPASRGRGSAKVSGGKNVVMQWVERFDVPPLNEMFRGIVDRDSGNTGSSRVYVLGRYSIENYRLDPPVIFGVLIGERQAPGVPVTTITPGDEHLIRSLPASTLQAVVDFVRGKIEPTLGLLTAAETAKVNVNFTNGVTLEYPEWMLTKKGHELLPAYQGVFGQGIITPPKLDQSFRRVRLVPIELAEIMAKLQET